MRVDYSTAKAKKQIRWNVHAVIHYIRLDSYLITLGTDLVGKDPTLPPILHLLRG